MCRPARACRQCSVLAPTALTCPVRSTIKQPLHTASSKLEQLLTTAACAPAARLHSNNNLQQQAAQKNWDQLTKAYDSFGQSPPLASRANLETAHAMMDMLVKNGMKVEHKGDAESAGGGPGPAAPSWKEGDPPPPVVANSF